MSLQDLRLNGCWVLAQYVTDPCSPENIEIQKVFYHSIDIAPILDASVLEGLSDEIYRKMDKCLPLNN
jgi:hypothetical protein